MTARAWHWLCAACAVVACSSDRVERGTGSFEVATATRRSDAGRGFRERDGAYHRVERVHRATVSKDGVLRFQARGSLDSVTFETVRAARDGQPVAVARGPATLMEDGTITIHRGVVRERLANDAHGIEQSWEVPQLPPGDGDLVIAVHADSVRRARPASGGVAFLEEGARSVTYNAARWIDARGFSRRLPISLEGSDLVMTVPRSLLLQSSFPAVLDPLVSAEMPGDPPVVGDVGLRWSSAQVTPGKDGGFFVSWVEHGRMPSPDDAYYIQSDEVRAVRVDADGTVLDGTGIVVAPMRDAYIYSPSAAFDGQNWLVVWNQWPYTGPCQGIRAARVSSAGVILDQKSIHLVCTGGSPRAGWDGAAFLVQFGDGNGVYGMYVAPDGSIPALPFPISSSASRGEALACDGASSCLSVRTTKTDLRATRIAKGGALSTESVLTLSATTAAPRVTFDGTNYIVTYEDSGSTRAVRVSAATAAAMEASPVTVAPVTNVAVAALGSTSLLTWVEPSSKQVKGARMSSAGPLAILDATPLSLTANAAAVSGSLLRPSPVAAASGARWLTLWVDERAHSDVPGPFVGRVDASGQPLDGDGKTVRKSAIGQGRPAIAGDASGYFAVWEDMRDGATLSPQVRGARVTASGTVVDPGGIAIDSSDAGSPAVAFDGANYMVTWSGLGQVHARMVSKDGVLGTSTSFAGWGSKVIFDGTNYVVLIANEGVFGARVSPAGVAVDATPFTISTLVPNGGGWEYVALYDAASNGQESIAVWPHAVGAQSALVAARFTKAGTLLDAKPIEITRVPYDLKKPAVAWNGREWVVAWHEHVGGARKDADIRVARVSASGLVMDPGGRTIATGSIFQGYPAVTSMNDGATTLVAWSEPRRADRDFDTGIFGSYLRAADGAVLDAPGIELADADGNEFFPSFAAIEPGKVLMVYARNDPATNVGIQRVRARIITSGRSAGAACTADAECGSRVCADGVCCESPCGDACRSCSVIPGKCIVVTGMEDADTCTGDRTCDAEGACKSKRGAGCTDSAGCAEGVCSRGICCDRACDGACETCAAPFGTCTIAQARSGSSVCAPYACDGTGPVCPTKCTSNEACPNRTRCHIETGACVAGSYCVDSTTVSGDGPERSCAPYACGEGVCRTSCRDVRDCIAPAVCDEAGRCVVHEAVALAGDSGCAAGGRASGSSPAAVSGLFFLAVYVARRARDRRAPRR